MVDKEKKKEYNKKYREKKKNNDNISEISQKEVKEAIEEEEKAQTPIPIPKKKKEKEMIYIPSSDDESSFDDWDQMEDYLGDIKYYIDKEIKKKLKKTKKRNIFRDDEKNDGMLKTMTSQLGQALVLGGLPIVLAYAKKAFLPPMPPIQQLQQMRQVPLQQQSQQQPNPLNGVF